MNKEFVTYEQALALKELGFDEPCFGYWFNNKKYFPNSIEHCSSQERCFYITGGLLAQTFSQAFRFFREKYNLKAYIIPIEYLDGTQETYQWNIFNKCHSGVDHLTYEEAEEACLDKLIEIVKNK